MTKPSYFALIPAEVRYDKDLSANAKLLYAEITALTSKEGFCWATNSYFAELYDMSTRNVSRLVSQLNDKGYIFVQIENEFERKIYINRGYDKNVQPPTQEMSKGYDKNVQPPHDKNVHKNNTSIINKKSNKENKNNIGEIEQEFDQLWKVYPRKIGKKKAFDSFKKARKIKKIPYEIIENGLYRYIDYLKMQGTEEQFIQHGSTFFNQEKWQDEFETTHFEKKPKLSSFTQMCLNEMDDPDEFLNMIGVNSSYDQGRNRKIIDVSESELH